MWAGESKLEGLYRKKNNDLISCTDPKVDGMICMTYEDLRKILDACEYWND